MQLGYYTEDSEDDIAGNVASAEAHFSPYHVVDKNGASAAIEQLINEATKLQSWLRNLSTEDIPIMGEVSTMAVAKLLILKTKALIAKIKAERDKTIGRNKTDNQDLITVQQELTAQLHGLCKIFGISQHQVIVIKPGAMNQATSTGESPMPLAA